jgi:RNA polymerase sigma-70 factor, ECF subfamily
MADRGAWDTGEIVDAASQSGDLVLPLASVVEAEVTREALFAGAPERLAEELWRAAEAERCGLGIPEFCAALVRVGAKCNYGQPAGAFADAAQKTAFLRGLRLGELALAQACASGIEVAWERFVAEYRQPLTQAAVAMSGSATVGHDLADAVYAELYGLREVDGERRSPLGSYSGRGSLMGWLRTTLAQRHVDHHRRTRREEPIEAMDVAAPPTDGVAVASAELERLSGAVAWTLERLPAEDRYLLAAYFLDRQTLLQIARLLRVHEATISRRLKRLTADLRKQLLHQLQAGGLSKRAAEEALGADPRDLEINLRELLQSSQTAAFLNKRGSGKEASTTMGTGAA